MISKQKLKKITREARERIISENAAKAKRELEERTKARTEKEKREKDLAAKKLQEINKSLTYRAEAGENCARVYHIPSEECSYGGFSVKPTKLSGVARILFSEFEKMGLNPELVNECHGVDTESGMPEDIYWYIRVSW